MKKIIVIGYIVFFQYQLFAQSTLEDSLFNEARFYYYTFNSDSAENYVERIVEYNPYYAKAYDLYGDVCRQKGLYAKGLEMYKKSIAIDSTDLNAIRHIATTNIDLRNYDMAIKILRGLIEKDSSNARYYVDIGDAFNKKGNKDQAIYNFVKAIELDQNYAMARKNLASVFFETNDWEKVINEYFEVIMLNNWYPIYKEMKYISLLAEPKFKLWIEQELNKDEAHYCYSFSAFYKYGADEAIREIERAIELNSQKEKYYLAKTYFLYNQKKYDEIIDEMVKCFIIYPNSWKCLNFLSKAYLQLGDTSSAFETATKSIAIDSTVISSNIIIGEILNRKNEYRLANQSLNKALLSQPYIPTTKLLYELAFAHYYLRQYKKAWYLAMAANKIFSVYGQQSFIDEDIGTEINFLINEIWNKMD